MAEFSARGGFPPPNAASIMSDLGAALRAQDISRAMDIARAALDQGVVHPALLTLRADWLREQGRLNDALADLEHAVGIAPNDIAALNTLGLCLQAMERHREAIAAFDRALAVLPSMSPALYNRAYSQEVSKDTAAARRGYEEALKQDPEFAEPLARLAILAARRGAWDDAHALIARALAISPDLQIAHVAKATLEIETGNFAVAEHTLTHILDKAPLSLSDRGMITSMLADAHDGQGRPDDAFRIYAAGNEMTRQAYAGRFGQPGAQTARDFVEMLNRYYAQAEPWPQAPQLAATPCAGHAFLVGFPRSGTTLLEQVLASHPDIAAIPEREFLLEGFQTFMGDDASLARLDRATPGQLDVLRNSYWRNVREFGIAPEGKFVLDKHPLNTIKLPLIAKLFPDAKILFALRDPRDVVLSCFRRRFQMNIDMYEFVTLDGTARFYDTVMRLGATFREKLPLAQRLTRHEALISDFESEMRGICEFLGLGWRDDFKDFARAASERDISTPSGPQIVRGLNSEGVGQWQRYKAHLEPVQPLLAPWVKTFGYAES